MTVNAVPPMWTERPRIARIRSEFLLPQRAAENDDGVAARDLIFFEPEAAADRRLDAHQSEEVAADQHAHLQLRWALSHRPRIAAVS